jgi:hypothetical protein
MNGLAQFFRRSGIPANGDSTTPPPRSLNERRRYKPREARLIRNNESRPLEYIIGALPAARTPRCQGHITYERYETDEECRRRRRRRPNRNGRIPAEVLEVLDEDVSSEGVEVIEEDGGGDRIEVIEESGSSEVDSSSDTDDALGMVDSDYASAGSQRESPRRHESRQRSHRRNERHVNFGGERRRHGRSPRAHLRGGARRPHVSYQRRVHVVSDRAHEANRIPVLRVRHRDRGVRLKRRDQDDDRPVGV